MIFAKFVHSAKWAFFIISLSLLVSAAVSSIKQFSAHVFEREFSNESQKAIWFERKSRVFKLCPLRENSAKCAFFIIWLSLLFCAAVSSIQQFSAHVFEGEFSNERQKWYDFLENLEFLNFPPWEKTSGYMWIFISSFKMIVCKVFSSD